MRIKTDLPLTLSVIAKILGTTIEFDGKINAITTDSRLCEKNDLFIALKGERFDGADFICDARKKEAFVISERNNSDFKVASAENALISIASAYKDMISPKYTIAVTGSVGKTTTKDFIHALLSSFIATHKTSGNYNNIIGLSYTILSMPKNTEALVCELGMNHIGEIEILSQALNPDISVITNIGTAHIGNLGSRKRIAQAKLEIESGMKNGKTVLFSDEPLLSAAKYPYRVSYNDFSADLFIKLISRSINGCEFLVKSKSFESHFKSKLYSKPTIDSLMLAIAVCDIMKKTEYEALIEAIQSITPENLRQKLLTDSKYKIYDDSYNSSPEAVVADLNMLSELGKNNSALLGDMLELGEKSAELHRYIGAQCAKYSMKKLYAFGKHADDIAKGAVAAGMDKSCVYINSDTSKPEITAKQISDTYSGEILLVKASHAIKINRITEILMKERGI